MSSAAVTKLAKPKIRGLFTAYLNKTFIVAGIGSAISGVAYYYAVLVRHRNRRDEFFANFNPDKEFERLRDLGFFWSIPPKDPKKALYNFLPED